jgi:hypothetical protein
MQNTTEKNGKNKSNLKVTGKSYGMKLSKNVRVDFEGKEVLRFSVFWDGSIVLHSGKEVMVSAEKIESIEEWVGTEGNNYKTIHLKQN